jgi:hypothetical protein
MLSSFASASDSNTVSLAAIGLVTIILGAVVTPLFSLLKANTKALAKVADSSEKVAKATVRSAKEAKERNGHLGDQNIRLAELVIAQNQDVSEVKHNTAKTADILSKSALIAAEDREVLTGATNQIIKKQTVEHQVIQETVD